MAAGGGAGEALGVVKSFIRTLAASLLLVAALELRAEIGLPLFDTYPQKTHAGGSQIFGATQDASGVLHFGSLRGVLSYDGAWWRVTALPNESAVFSVAAGRGPEIAVGAYRELGYVARDPHGTLVYRSLVPQLPAEFRDVGDVRSVCATASGFVFVGEHALIAWGGGAPRVVADLRNVAKPPTRCATAGGATYLFGGDGLQRFGSTVSLLQGRRVESVIGLDATRVLASVAGEGLFAIDGASATPFAAEASAWLRDKTVVGGSRAGNRLVIGTRQHGLLILDASGGIQQRLDVSADLPGDVLAAVLTDRDGAVWLGYYGPIVRLDLAMPVSLLDERIGLHGSASAVKRFRDSLHVATSHGLYVLQNGAARRIDGVPAPVWSLAVAGDELLAGTGEGVFVVDGRVRRVAGTEDVVVYDLLPSGPQVWVAARKGIGTLTRSGGDWQFDGLMLGTPRYAQHMFHHDGAVWAGSIFDGAIRIENGQVRKFGTGEVNAGLAGGRVLVCRDNTLYRIDANGQLVADPALEHVIGNLFRFDEDAKGNLWTNSTPPQFVARRGNGTYAPAVPLVSIDAANIQLVQADPDGTIWFAGDEALYRYDSNVAAAHPPQPRPLIQRVVTPDGRLVAAPLPYAFRRLRVEFAPLTYRAGVRYQYRLGDDDPWSEWTAQPFIDYTNVDAGEHLFQVRARSAAGAVSPVATWRFTVLPPWYRTRATIALWILCVAGLVAAIVRLRTAALRRQAARLQLLVDERTAELQQANAHLERLSLVDELTGIANRRYFQRALVEDWRNALEEQQPLALVLIDLDYFKQLNDRHGHQAGDAALVQTARLLARQIRRSGDVPTRASDIVARIGGEEFAVLLAKTDEDDAMRVAETLRAGIAAMELTGGEGRILTASCGVAAMVPEHAEGWSALVQRADAALYAAKAAGRNRVQAAGDAGDRASLAV